MTEAPKEAFETLILVQAVKEKTHYHQVARTLFAFDLHEAGVRNVVRSYHPQNFCTGCDQGEVEAAECWPDRGAGAAEGLDGEQCGAEEEPV